MAKPRRAYFVDGQRFTLSQFKRLSRARKIAGMVEWFGSNFEDPANQVSYQTREGGYLWGGSGPHDADEELQQEFGDLATYEEIQEAVDEVQYDGTVEWASSQFFREPDDEPEDEFDEDGNRSVERPLPDFSSDFESDDGVATGEVADGDGDEWPPLVGVPAEERELRAEVVADLDRFDAVANAIAADRARRGHNHPPELVEGDGLPWRELEAARYAAAELREETGKEEPDTGRIASAVQKVRNLAGELGKWLAVVVGSGVVGGAAWDGAKAAYQNPSALYNAATTLAHSANEWMQHLTNFW